MPDAGDRARARRIIDRVRSYGVEVREMPGHENRGGTFVIVPVKVFDHHDASSRKAGEWGSLGLIMDGTPRGILGPLSNAQVARCLDGKPRIAWVADGTTSHGGRGSGLGLPTNAANPRTYGVEKANDGLGEPYTAAANYATNALFHAMAVECGVIPESFPWGHKEWTTRKIDPLYSMPDRRRQVAAFAVSSAPTQEDTVSMEDVVQSWYGPRFRDGDNFAQVIHKIQDGVVSSNARIADLTAALNTLAQALASGRDDLTAAEVTDAVDQGIRRGGAAVLAAQEAARAATDKPA